LTQGTRRPTPKEMRSNFCGRWDRFTKHLPDMIRESLEYLRDQGYQFDKLQQLGLLREVVDAEHSPEKGVAPDVFRDVSSNLPLPAFPSKPPFVWDADIVPGLQTVMKQFDLFLAEAMYEDGTDRYFYTADGFESFQYINPRDTLFSVIDELTNASQSLSPPENAIEKITERVRSAMLSEELQCWVFVPLCNVDLEIDSFRVTRNCFICRLPKPFSSAIRKEIGYHANGSEERYTNASHTLVYKNIELMRTFRLQNSFRGARLLHAHTTHLDNAAIAFLILGLDSIDLTIRIAKPRFWELNHSIFTSPKEPVVFSYRDHDRYATEPTFDWQRRPIISIEDLVDFQNILDRLDKTENQRLEVAKRRLKSCYTRHYLEDVLIDASVGLEALFLNDSKELGYKLAMRLTKLFSIQNELLEPELEFKKRVENMYNCRSTVVHGEAPRIGRIKEHADFALSLLRLSIRILIYNPKYLDPKELDSTMLQQQPD